MKKLFDLSKEYGKGFTDGYLRGVKRHITNSIKLEVHPVLVKNNIRMWYVNIVFLILLSLVVLLS